MNNVQVPRAPFFGRYVTETMMRQFNSESVEEKRKRETRLKELFEAIDDYIEQA